jgi:hypothetical protein
MDARTPRPCRDEPSHGPELNPDEARQAVKTGYMRRILGVSTLLAVVALVASWFLSERRAAKPVARPAAVGATQAPILPRDQQTTTTQPEPAAPQSSQPLP